MSDRLRALLWQAIGLSFYLFGLLVFLTTVVGIYLAPPANSFANFSPGHGVGLGIGVGFLLAGKIVTWKFADPEFLSTGLAGDILGTGPDQNRLQELGYNVPPGEVIEDAPAREYEGGEVYLMCPDCGKRNDPDYRFCANCSAELPDV